MDSSENPIRLLNFVFNLYQQPLLNRTFPTLISDLFLRRLDPLYPQEHLILYPFIQIRCISLPLVRKRSASWTFLPTTSGKGLISVCSLRFMLRLPRLIDHWVVPTSKSSLAVYFRAFIPPVTVQYVGYIYLVETDKLPRRDFHPLGQIFYWLRPHLNPPPSRARG